MSQDVELAAVEGLIDIAVGIFELFRRSGRRICYRILYIFISSCKWIGLCSTSGQRLDMNIERALRTVIAFLLGPFKPSTESFRFPSLATFPEQLRRGKGARPEGCCWMAFSV